MKRHFNAMQTESQTLTQIQYRHYKGIVAEMERQLGCGSKPVAAETEKAYQGYLVVAERLGKQLGKEKAAP